MRALARLTNQLRIIVKNICIKKVSSSFSEDEINLNSIIKKYNKKFICSSLQKGFGLFSPDEVKEKAIWKDKKTGILYLWIIYEPKKLQK
jgi:hypothetical protein